MAIALLASCCAAEGSRTKSDFEKALTYSERKQFKLALAFINRAISKCKNGPVPAEYYCERGRTYLEVGNWALGVEDLSKAIALNPKDSKAYRRRGYCYLMMHDFNKGVADLKKAISLIKPDPIDLIPYNDQVNLSKAYQLMGKKDLLAKNARNAAFAQTLQDAKQQHRDQADPKGACLMVEKVLAVEPKNIQALLLHAVCSNNAGNFQAACKDLDKVVAIVPDAVPVLFFRADCYRELKQYDKAIADFTVIIKQKPSLVLADYTVQIGRSRDVVTYRDAETINLADVYFLRAQCYSSSKRLPEALKDYEMVVKLDPAEFEGFFQVGNVNFELKRYDKAIENYTKAIALKEDYLDAYTQRSQAYEKSGNIDKALADLSHVILVNSKEPGAFLMRAQLLERSNKVRQALDDYTQVIRLVPNDYDAYRYRADAYCKVGEYALAIKDYDRALKLKTEDRPEILKARAHAEAMLKNKR